MTEAFVNVAKTYCSASGPEKTGAICYAVGWTQHSSGVQIFAVLRFCNYSLATLVALAAILALPRSRIDSRFHRCSYTLRHSSGYLSDAKFGEESKTLASYINATLVGGRIFDKYIVSLLKAYYGESATPENDFGFNWLPRITGDHSHQGYWLEMLDGRMDGLFIMGQNPGGCRARLQVSSAAHLVNSNGWWCEMVETSQHPCRTNRPNFSGELRPEHIGHRNFPHARTGHAKKETHFSPTLSGFCNGAKRLSIPRAIAAANSFSISPRAGVEAEIAQNAIP